MHRFIPGRPFAAAIALAAALALAPQAAAQNLLANPGFEDAGGSYMGWFSFGSGPQISLPSTDNIARTGVAAAKVFGEFTNCPGGEFTVGGFGQSFTPVVGDLYTLSGHSYVSSVDPIPGTDTCNRNRMIAKVVFFDAPSGGNELAASEFVIGDGNSLLDQWVAFSVAAPAPAGAQRVEALFLFLQPACEDGAVFVDDASLVRTTPPAAVNVLANPSFNMGLMGWNAFGNVFPDSRPFIVRTPSGAAKIFGPFSLPGDASGLFQAFEATAGMDWHLDVYSLNTCRDDPVTGTNDNFATAKISFFDVNGVEIGSGETVIADNSAPLGAWTHHSVVANAPAGTDSMKAFLLFVQPGVMGGSFWVDDASLREMAPVSVSPAGAQAVELRQNAPNPFARGTRIGFSLASRGPVELGVFDLLGRRVATLVRGELEAGAHVVRWDGRSDAGEAMAAGVYHYALSTPAGREMRRMVLTR